jgi:hypothetical protein
MWIGELDCFTDVPFMADGRLQPLMPAPQDLVKAWLTPALMRIAGADSRTLTAAGRSATTPPLGWRA